MANRSYLYSVHQGEEPEVRDLAEWNYNIPLIHLLLVGFDGEVVPTRIWDNGAMTAILGSGPPARAFVSRVLDWLEPQLPDAGSEIAEARSALTRADRQGTGYLLEAGEVYALSAGSLEQMQEAARRDLKASRVVVEELRGLMDEPSATIASAQHFALTDAFSDWKQDLGLYFADVLYFHLG